MICCMNCFTDIEIRAVIKRIGHSGNCPICGAKHTFLYDSDTDFEVSEFEEYLTSIIEIYKPDDLLDENVPFDARKSIEEHLNDDWKIFNYRDIKLSGIHEIVTSIIQHSMTLDQKLIFQKCAVPELFDEEYMSENSIMGSYSWIDFKGCLRNENRFHNHHINLNLLGDALKDTETKILKGEKFFRARLATEKSGFTNKDMGAPPKDKATAGRANSKGISCLYLADKKETTVKEIRAGAFDFVTIGTFKLNCDIKVLDLSSITHNSPFIYMTDKKKFLINERNLNYISEDLAKPMNSQDSDLEYLPTQYISDFAKSLGYDGVKYISTFDENSYNLALFDLNACSCVYHKTYQIGDLNYKLNTVD